MRSFVLDTVSARKQLIFYQVKREKKISFHVLHFFFLFFFFSPFLTLNLRQDDIKRGKIKFPFTASFPIPLFLTAVITFARVQAVDFILRPYSVGAGANANITSLWHALMQSPKEFADFFWIFDGCSTNWCYSTLVFCAWLVELGSFLTTTVMKTIADHSHGYCDGVFGNLVEAARGMHGNKRCDMNCLDDVFNFLRTYSHKGYEHRATYFSAVFDWESYFADCSQNIVGFGLGNIHVIQFVGERQPSGEIHAFMRWKTHPTQENWFERTRKGERVRLLKNLPTKPMDFVPPVPWEDENRAKASVTKYFGPKGNLRLQQQKCLEWFDNIPRTLDDLRVVNERGEPKIPFVPCFLRPTATAHAAPATQPSPAADPQSADNTIKITNRKRRARAREPETPEHADVDECATEQSLLLEPAPAATAVKRKQQCHSIDRLSRESVSEKSFFFFSVQEPGRRKTTVAVGFVESCEEDTATVTWWIPDKLDRNVLVEGDAEEVSSTAAIEHISSDLYSDWSARRRTMKRQITVKDEVVLRWVDLNEYFRNK